MIKVTVKNKEAVLAAIGRLAPQTRKNLDAALATTARQMATAAKARAPVDTGALRRSIDVNRGRDIAGSPGWVVTANVFYARFVEFGTRASFRGQVLSSPGAGFSKKKEKRRVKLGNIVRRARRTHPGTRAQPFFWPSYRAVKPFLAERVANAVERGLRGQ